MSAEALLADAKLDEAIAALVAEVKERPGELARRTFLFELLCFAGELDRAGRQLEAIGHLDAAPTAMVGVQAYRNLLEAERTRAKLFDQGVRPRFILEPPENVKRHLEAIELLRAERTQEAAALIQSGGEPELSIRGRAGGSEFEGLCDADDLLGPVLEVFAATGYYWIPWEHVQYLEVPAPQGLRDLLWAPAKLATFDGQLGEVFLPCLYPGTSAQADGPTRLGRVTDWRDEHGLVRGVGRKLFLVGDDARTVQELATIELEPPTAAAGGTESQPEG